MRSAKTLAALALSLLLVGAGCASSTNTNIGLEDPNPSDDEITVNMDDFSAANDTSTTPDKTVEPSTGVDDSWKTYTNTALNFEFKWPSKGKYAPQWDMTALKENDESVSEGCVGKGGDATVETMKVGDNTFCHTFTNAPTVDKYTTKVGSSWVVLTFKKDAGADFDWTAYRASLDQIVSTFKMTK